MRYQRAELPLKLDSLGAACEFFSGCFGKEGRGRETLWVAHLDDEARCLHLSRHHGNARAVDIPVRAIIIAAALYGTAQILLAPYHPSGDVHPSDSDLRATRRLATAAGAPECKVIDHLVFAGAACTSLRNPGYL